MNDDLIRRLRAVMVTHSENGTPLGTPFADALCREAADALERGREGWQPIETAPKDGSPIVAWCVHQNAQYAKDPIAEGWAAVVVARWIEHNGGGWTWHGHAGEFTHWMPLPNPPKTPGKRG